jgi:hypothetical protein
LTIDRSGRWRFIATREIGIADGRQLVRGGHVLRLLKKKQQVLTVAGNLRSQDDLPELLVELNQLALEESGQPATGVEGEPTWNKETTCAAGKEKPLNAAGDKTPPAVPSRRPILLAVSLTSLAWLILAGGAALAWRQAAAGDLPGSAAAGHRHPSRYPHAAAHQGRGGRRGVAPWRLRTAG